MQQRQRNPARFAWLFLILSLVFAGALQADEPAVDDHFQNGLFEASLGSGVMFSPVITGVSRPRLNYTVTEAELGYMLTDVSGSSILRGNFEVAASLWGGGIFSGEGNYVSGSTLWLRYNFVPRASRFAPYMQAGMGLTYTDLNRRLEGQSFNFNLNLGAGVRYFIARNWSLDLECRFQHISNADMSKHNQGVNAIGPMLSVSYFF